MRTQFRAETCGANKVRKNLSALVIGECVYKNFFTFVDFRTFKFRSCGMVQWSPPLNLKIMGLSNAGV
jgi:hypothetical protein